jgi:hypothetical protein
MNELLIRRYRQFLTAIIVHAVQDRDQTWLCSDDCQEILDLLGVDLLAGHYRADLNEQAIGHAFNKSLTAAHHYPVKGTLG